MKDFKGQYSGERLLFKGYESKVSFISHIFVNSILVLLFCLVIVIIFYYIYSSVLLSILIIFIFLFILIFFNYLTYRGTYLLFTSRRIVKNVRNGFFIGHKKELHIKNFKNINSTVRSFLGRIFRFGNLTVEGEGKIYFRGLANHEEVSQYISRIWDYIHKNGPTDELMRFKTRKERYNK